MLKIGGFMKNRNAFTLAEVLITLGIIGVVAALTLPGLMANYQKKATVTQVKKVYTSLYQAVLLSEAKNGPIESWDFDCSDSEFFEKYLQEYMPTILNTRYMNISNEVKYKNPNGNIEQSFTPLYGSAKVVSLQDGTMLFLTTGTPTRTLTYHNICVDINGMNPNIIGRDFFGFAVVKSNAPKVVPYGTYGTSDDPMTSMDRDSAKSGMYACTRDGRGMFCAALMMLDGWEIKNDYPW